MRNRSPHTAMRSGRLTVIAAALVLQACVQTKLDRTSLDVEVQSSFIPGVEVDELRVTATVTRPVVRMIAVDEVHPFPIRFGLTPARTPSEEIFIEVTGLKLGQDVASASVQTRFEPGAVRSIVIDLNGRGVETSDGGVSVDAIGACSEGAVEACGCNGMGKGSRTCSSGFWSACKAFCEDTGLLGRCGRGTRVCDETQTVPTWGACSIAPEAADSCEAGADENCNGVKNEGCPCTKGAKRSCADAALFGTCAAGTQTCTSGGTWEKCSLEPKAQDTCAVGNDDNCNGAKNEGCECVVGDTRTCGAGGQSGRCAAGSQTCSAAGRWNPCSIQPLQKDTCVDGNDDNCNGRPNEGCPCVTGTNRSCAAGGFSGKCAEGTQACGAATWGVCSILPDLKDTCVTGNDDNCNGRPNEGCSCLAGNVRTCGAGGAQGRCALGTQRCSTSGEWSACSVQPASADACGTADNDDNCNGVKSEGCVCLPGTLRCNGSNAQKCNSDGRSFTTENCGRAGCNSASGQCLKECTPQARRCNGKAAEVCSEQSEWIVDRVCDRCEGEVCRDCEEAGSQACWNDSSESFSTGGYSVRECVDMGPHRVWSDPWDCMVVCDPDPGVCE